MVDALRPSSSEAAPMEYCLSGMTRDLSFFMTRSWLGEPESDQRSGRQLSSELPVFPVSEGRGTDPGWQEVW